MYIFSFKVEESVEAEELNIANAEPEDVASLLDGEAAEAETQHNMEE